MRSSLVLAVCALAALGCSDDESSGGGSGGSAGSGGGSGSGGISSLPAGWNEIAPGGETICSRGTPYRYWVRPGTLNRVVIDFRGGGACWNTFTCSLTGSSAIFQETVEPDENVLNGSYGIYQQSNPDNPFKDWHHVYIPYCTGDVHWGNAERTYGEGASAYTIHHKGAVNVRAVLDWVYANVPDPEKIFVTGCSAGAYGSIMWAPHIKNHYTKAKVYHLADSGAGVITDTFFAESFPTWNAVDSYPTFIPGVDPASFDRLPELYQQIGGYFTDMFISQYNTVYDDNQHFYYEAMGGGDVYEWSTKMKANVSEIQQSTPSFRAYYAPGHQHCIIGYPNFYDASSNGVRLVDWIKDAIDDKQPASVDCAPDCGSPL